MEAPRSLQNLIDFVRYVENTQRNERLFQMEATAVTPNDQIPLLMPSGFSRNCLFTSGRSDDATIRVQTQPGVYTNKILPFRDNLIIEIVEREKASQIKYRFRAIPLTGNDPQMQGGHSALADLASKDNMNMITVDFQLLELGFAKIRNEPVSDIYLMSSMDNVLHDKLTESGSKLGLTGPDAWKGVDIEYPIDNDRVFKQVVIPFGNRLIDLGEFLQMNEEYGIYNTGLGMYYRKGLWRVYPLFRMGRYEKARRVLNVYRLPENVFPTLHNSWIMDDKSITVFSTGGAHNSETTDIDRQEHGVGKRIISVDAAMGETGRYYNKGVAATTRGDSLSEYKTVSRASGEEWVPTVLTPTGNLCKHLSENAQNDVSITGLSWHNSNAALIDPCMPVRYYYMSGSEALMYREGSVGGLRTVYQADTESVNTIFREHSVLSLTIGIEEFSVK